MGCSGDTGCDTMRHGGTVCDGNEITTDQKVGGSNPSEPLRAQVRALVSCCAPQGTAQEPNIAGYPAAFDNCIGPSVSLPYGHRRLCA